MLISLHNLSFNLTLHFIKLVLQVYFKILLETLDTYEIITMNKSSLQTTD